MLSPTPAARKPAMQRMATMKAFVMAAGSRLITHDTSTG